MSERFKGCWVSFDGDYYQEDAKFIMQAIEMIRGVSDTSLDNTSVGHEDFMARSRVRDEFSSKLLDLYREVRVRKV